MVFMPFIARFGLRQREQDLRAQQLLQARLAPRRVLALPVHHLQQPGELVRQVPPAEHASQALVLPRVGQQVQAAHELGRLARCKLLQRSRWLWVAQQRPPHAAIDERPEVRLRSAEVLQAHGLVRAHERGADKVRERRWWWNRRL